MLKEWRLLQTLSRGSLQALLLLSMGVRAHAQEAPGSAVSQKQNKIILNSDLVVLPVTVKDGNGNLVAGMQQEDFRVYDDKVEQTIDVFSAEGFPLSLVLLIDDDLKDDDAQQMVASLHSVLAGISPSDEALVSTFDLKFSTVGDFTENPDRLFDNLLKAQEASKPGHPMLVPFVAGPSWHGLTPGEPTQAAPTDLRSRPTKALDDAIYSAAELLKDRGRNRRKIILLVSDGINGLEFNHHKYEETIAALLAENVSVYSVAVGGTSFHKKFSRLLNYANDSGGDVYYAKKSEVMEKLYSQITEQARYQYTLAYVPSGNNRDSNYHVVHVKATRDGLYVKTREGYYTKTFPDAPAQ